jgi:hypothetical protein
MLSPVVNPQLGIAGFGHAYGANGSARKIISTLKNLIVNAISMGQAISDYNNE